MDSPRGPDREPYARAASGCGMTGNNPFGGILPLPREEACLTPQIPPRGCASPGGTFADHRQGGNSAITPGSKAFRLYSLVLVTAPLALLTGIYIFPAQVDSSIPRLTFTKTLKGSSPEYMALCIDANGNGTYDSHKLEDPPNPRPMQVSSGTTAEIFSLADSLQNFRSLDLDSHQKVANMGLKTLTYQAGKETNQVQYNYTEMRTARELTDIFEKISNVEERISDLEYAMKYDHLSLPQILSQTQQGLDDNLFVEAHLMIPTLEKISNDPRFLHLAQTRAREILRRIER